MIEDGVDDGPPFRLHERLAADTVPVCRWPLCRVLLMDNRLWPWLILVPERPEVVELHQLSRPDRLQLMDETAGAGAVLYQMLCPDKLNVAAIGNIVSQLHIHIVARRRDDPAWPNPVWGCGLQERYEPAARDALRLRLRAALGSDGAKPGTSD